MRPWYLIHCRRRHATPSRSRSLATSVFFVSKPLFVDKVPDRVVIHDKTLLSKLRDKPHQREIPPPDPRPQPALMRPGDLAALVTVHPTRCRAPRPTKTRHPGYRRARALGQNDEPRRDTTPRHAQPLKPPVRQDQWKMVLP